MTRESDKSVLIIGKCLKICSVIASHQRGAKEINNSVSLTLKQIPKVCVGGEYLSLSDNKTQIPYL